MSDTETGACSDDSVTTNSKSNVIPWIPGSLELKSFTGYSINLKSWRPTKANTDTKTKKIAESLNADSFPSEDLQDENKENLTSD